MMLHSYQLNLLSVAQEEPLVWPFFMVMTLFGLGIFLSFLDTIGGPIINTFVAFFQNAFHALTKRPFTFYPQWNKQSLPHAKRVFLFEQVHYYKFLNTAERKAFDHRVVKFLRSRDFIAKENVVITEEMKLLIITQKVDMNDDLLGFFHDWIIEFSKHFEEVTFICLKKGEYDLPQNVKVLSLGKETNKCKLKYIYNFYKNLYFIKICHENYTAIFNLFIHYFFKSNNCSNTY